MKFQNIKGCCIPLKQHSNMLHAFCRAFNKIVESDFQHYVECCGNKQHHLLHLSHTTKSHATCCLLLNQWNSTYYMQQCCMPHVASVEYRIYILSFSSIIISICGAFKVLFYFNVIFKKSNPMSILVGWKWTLDFDSTGKKKKLLISIPTIR